MLAVIVVAALTISTAAMVQLTTSNQTAFTRDRLETRAFNTAEQGLNTAVATLRGFDNGSRPQNSTYGSSGTPVACCDGLGGWWALKTSATQWTIWAVGRAPNGDVLRTLSMRAQADTVTTTTQPSLAWANGFFVGDAAGLHEHGRNLDAPRRRVDRRQPLPQRHQPDRGAELVRARRS